MKLLTLARDLQRRKARERHGAFVAEGVRTVEDLIASSLTVTGLLHSEEASDTPRAALLLETARERGVPVQGVSAAEFASAATTDAPQGVLAIASVPDAALVAPTTPVARYLVLDALQDPGNVGTIIRTAAAFGVTATLALPGTVDVWNAKVVRSAMGALFRQPVIAVTADALRMYLQTHAITCWAADTGGDLLSDAPEWHRKALPARLALVVSNEGAGLSAAAAGLPDRLVAVGMAPGTESLNVAVATGILLHALRPA